MRSPALPCCPPCKLSKWRRAVELRPLRAATTRRWKPSRADYCEHLDKFTYDDLMKLVPKAERTRWHEKAIEASKGADRRSRMELPLETGELERLADLVGRSKDSALEGLSHYATEPAAKKLEKTNPGIAARLWRARGCESSKSRKTSTTRRRFRTSRGPGAVSTARGSPSKGRKP